MIPPRAPPTGLLRVTGPAAAEMLFEPLRHQRTESAMFAYLDANRFVLGMRRLCAHSVDTQPLPIREIARDALAFDAAAMILAHNHPSGDPAPSAADREATWRLEQAMRWLDIRLDDHLILARGGSTSFRAAGLL